ncbi:hypothetical protein niasHT_036907 [Heterodera trifolii]|uniref:BTB domain-containing protein n=1 Tax=Heterodera trifolii TaxID=157864 RepID=A0ABD2ID08_9BILA
MSKACPVADRMRWLLLAGDGADVHFLVGDEKKEFSAHKAILLASSDVFKAMFRFDEQNAKKEAPPPPVAKKAKKTKSVAGGKAPSAGVLAGDVVVIPDVTAVAFKAMLAFIYADDLSELNGDNLFDVLYAALRWADEQCAKNGKECTGENRREMLGPALRKIHFSLIAQNDFSNIIVPSDVLSKDEMLSVFMSYSRTAAAATAGPSLLPAPYPLHFPTDQRMAVQKDSSDSQPRSTALNDRNGRITMKIEKFSEFAQVENKRRISDAVNIRGFSWRIHAYLATDIDDKKKYLAYFLHCNESANKGEEKGNSFHVF